MELKPACGQPIKPHYASNDYRAFVKAEKAKGLQRKYWPDLPKMWLEELKFRHEIESALRSFASKP